MRAFLPHKRANNSINININRINNVINSVQTWTTLKADRRKYKCLKQSKKQLKVLLYFGLLKNYLVLLGVLSLLNNYQSVSYNLLPLILYCYSYFRERYHYKPFIYIALKYFVTVDTVKYTISVENLITL